MSDQGEQIQKTDEIDDVGGDVAAALNELRGGETTPQTEITLDKAPQRSRDEGGRYAKEEKADKLPEFPDSKLIKAEKAPIAEAAPAGQAATTPAATSAVPAIEPPAGWTADAKAKWGEVPEWAQKEAARREKELTDKIFAHDEARNFGAKLQQAANPYMATIQMEGADVPKAFQNYLQTAYVLRQGSPMQKAMALHSIAQQFNVDLSLPHQQGGVHPEVADLRHQLQQMQGQMQGQEQQRKQQEDWDLKQQIADFAKAPGHEHFERVRARMGALFDSDPAMTLEEAYQQAIWSHPEVRTILQQAEIKAAEAKRLEEQKALSERARSAAVSVTGAPGSSRPLNGAGSRGSIEDDVRAALAEVSGRV